MSVRIDTLFQKSMDLTPLSFDESLSLLQIADSDLDQLLEYANRIKLKHVGKSVYFCNIINAKSGKCSEDCIFCAQSAHHHTDCVVTPLSSHETLYAAASSAEQMGAHCFSIVTSGRGLSNPKEFDIIIDAISQHPHLYQSASLGILEPVQLIALKHAGLQKYHHNLETCRSFFPKMCTTHTYEDRIATINSAKNAGLSVCSGALFGLGESIRQRAELCHDLADLNVDSIPLNFLHPIPGTPAYERHIPMTIPDILKTIAMFRFTMPAQRIGVIGGREYHLKEKQPLIFPAGANMIMIGHYLTTSGNSVAQDKQMIESADLFSAPKNS